MELAPQIAALYIGQKIQTPDGIGVLCGANNDGIVCVEFGAMCPDFVLSHHVSHVKPILRRLSSLTESERITGNVWALDKERYPNHPSGFYTPMEFAYLLSLGFDLFGLIDSGAAIDAAAPKTVEV